MDALEKERWIALSPLLDQLLDRDEEDRQRWLAQLRAHDAATADELEALLAKDQALHAKGFMAQPAAEQMGGVVTPVGESVAELDLTGESIGPYQLEREVGQGGMGAVWLARRADGRFQGEVAIKFLKAGLFGKGDNGRFAREGQILGRLSHPHIARLLDAGVHSGHQPYLVLEYVDGLPIDRYCHVHGLDIEARIRLFQDVLAAVAHAHQRLILHRDLKPSNILVTADGQVKLLDFGIAKLMDDATQPAAATELTQLAGSAFTPQYAAPEQIQQGDVTTATDVYALGVLLYQLLGGRHPTADDTQTHLDRLKAVVELVPKRLSEVAGGQLDPVIARQAKLLKGDLDTIVAKALKKSPAERYANAEQFSADLNHWLQHEPITARPDTRWYVLGRFVRRHRLAVGASTAAVLALVGLTTFSVLQAHRAEQAEHQAQQRRQQADDLLSFMLGEFADKLRPIGRLELLDSVGTKALSYLSANEGLSPQERLQRAKALTVLGEVRVAKRDMEGAREPLIAAQALLQGPPPSKEMAGAWYKAQGVAAFWEGHSYFTKRQFEKAQGPLERYASFSKAWLDAQPDSEEALTELAYAENSLGSLRLENTDFDGAVRSFTASIAIKRKVIANSTPERALALKAELADSMSWLGTTWARKGNAHEALQAFINAIALLEEVRSSQPKSGILAYQLAAMHRSAAQTALRLSELELATQHIDEAVRLMDALHAQDPSNMNWRINLLITRSLQLEYRRDVASSANRLEPWEAIAAEWLEIEKTSRAKASPVAMSERYQSERGYAKALAAAGRFNESAAVFERILSGFSDKLIVQKDFVLLLIYVDTSVAALQLLPEAEGFRLKRHLLCSHLADEIAKMPQFIGVNPTITKGWDTAQSCLGVKSQAVGNRSS
ncbi:serine/threonine protein kinase [Roseateles depolymerans]|uniref:Protein kinase n=1 Tax=Roseateles depolymerans TaxID=76731 RepID=A0A0U3MSK6_9BURK|nr:serine/threonine-protein kinase [Roseateles depolymerans]ALV04836.1 Protein kinase [Roseateles depolymerans]REG15152.1 serine/threonine protein kinase [Roseateles depolymerans]